MKINLIGMILNNAGRRCFDGALLPEHAGLLCMVADGSHYVAELITMPDFGCVMHEAAQHRRPAAVGPTGPQS